MIYRRIFRSFNSDRYEYMFYKKKELQKNKKNNMLLNTVHSVRLYILSKI
jgi:hypothetical protein